MDIVSLRPKIWCYLRVSTEEQRKSFARVLEQSQSLIKELLADGCEYGGIYEETESAVSIRWNERPAFMELMKVMQPGDHLIIEAKDRLDRDDVDMLVCLQWLCRRQIVLHCLNTGGRAIDLGERRERLLNHFDAIAASEYAESIRIRTKEALAYRKRNGYAFGPVPFGYKIVPMSPSVDGSKPLKRYVPINPHDIDEIVQRHERGESFYSIAKDWHKQKRKCDGRPWVLIARTKWIVIDKRIRKAYETHKQLEAAIQLATTAASTDGEREASS